MTLVIQSPGIKWVVNLLQLKLEYPCDLFTPKIHSQENKYVIVGNFMWMTVLSHQHV
jgi:hypothetical protein